MKARPPTLREKKRYILAGIWPPEPEPDPKELYGAVLEAVTSLFGDAATARIRPVVISCGTGYVLLRCSRGCEKQFRIALATLTSVGERRIVLHPKATSGTLLALRRKIPPALPAREGEELVVQYGGKEWSARRYQGQKIDLLEKGIKGQAPVYITQDDIEELACSHRHTRWDTTGQ